MRSINKIAFIFFIILNFAYIVAASLAPIIGQMTYSNLTHLLTILTWIFIYILIEAGFLRNKKWAFWTALIAYLPQVVAFGFSSIRYEFHVGLGYYIVFTFRHFDMKLGFNYFAIAAVISVLMAYPYLGKLRDASDVSLR